jgi:RNA polymerase sigma factor (sigma-70 family)
MANLITAALRVPLLHRDQEIALGRQVQAWMAIRDTEPTTAADRRTWRRGIRARDQLVVHNLRFAYRFISRHLRCCKTLDREDLLQAATIGLTRAAELFKPEHGCRFVTYATLWIRQSVDREIWMADDPIRIPANLHTMKAKIGSLTSAGMSPEDAMAAALQGRTTPPELIEAALSVTRPLASLDGPVRDCPDLNLHETIADGGPLPLDLVADEIGTELVQVHVLRLRDLQRDIIERVYGFNTEPQPMTAIARETNRSRQAVKQIHDRAISQLERMINVDPAIQ